MQAYVSRNSSVGDEAVTLLREGVHILVNWCLYAWMGRVRGCAGFWAKFYVAIAANEMRFLLDTHSTRPN